MHGSVRIPLPPTTAAVRKPTVVFTTPANYATRLSNLLTLRGHTPLWCPTITTDPTPHALSSHLLPHALSLLSAIAFPSRTSITSFSLAALPLKKPLLPPEGDTFILAALGKDAELIDGVFISQICSNFQRIKVLVPPIATPSGLARSLGEGGGRRVLCPVPRVVGLEEPAVVPNFLRDLEAVGWAPVRVDAYETRWMGPSCAEGVVRRGEEDGEVDAVVFTSSGEVEGFLKSLRELGWNWEMVRRRWSRLLVAAHGPVTAAGAERLGVDVDVVGSRFDSFNGVVDALDRRLCELEHKQD
ncbi:hypothetical protein SLA2020_285580 [Shorea laevis]